MYFLMQIALVCFKALFSLLFFVYLFSKTALTIWTKLQTHKLSPKFLNFKLLDLAMEYAGNT